MSYRKPLRYLGDKSYLAKSIQPFITSNTTYIEPFSGAFTCGFGLKCDKKIYNDISKPVYEFWCCLKADYKLLYNRINELVRLNCDCEALSKCRNSFDIFERTAAYWILNRLSNGVMSEKISKYRLMEFYINFCTNSVSLEDMFADYSNRLKDVEILNDDYSTLKYENAFYFIDPPYFYTDNIHFYGKHCNSFSHDDLFSFINSLNEPWVLTYDEAPYIRQLYQDYTVLDNIVYSAFAKDFKTELVITNCSEFVKVFSENTKYFDTLSPYCRNPYMNDNANQFPRVYDFPCADFYEEPDESDIVDEWSYFR